jgi:two-component system NtrC family sensor kinase
VDKNAYRLTQFNRMNNSHHFRILVIDEDKTVHHSLRKIFKPSKNGKLAFVETKASSSEGVETATIEVTSAYHGQEGLDLVRQANQKNQPYAVAFIVFCLANHSYSSEEIALKFDQTNNLLILEKPFNDIEVRQMVNVLAEK